MSETILPPSQWPFGYCPSPGEWQAAFNGIGNVLGPGSSIIGDVVAFSGTDGKHITDTGIVAASLVVGPASVVSGNLAGFADGTGKLLEDSGVGISQLTTGPNSSVLGDIVVFGDTTGKVLVDSGVPYTSLAVGPVGAVNGNIVAFNGTTGGLFEDSGVSVSTIVANAAFPPVATTAALTASTSGTLAQSQCYVQGFAANGDGGEDIFVVGPNATIDGGTIFNDASGRSWYRQGISNSISVLHFGADPTNTADCTAAFQAALNVMGARGGGRVDVPPGRYKFTGVLTVPAYVTLQGTMRGPFDTTNSTINPAATTFCPMLLVTNTSSNFLTLNGESAAVEDMGFYYPNQVTWSASTPTAYPITISIPSGSIGAAVRRVLGINPYHFIDCQVARCDFDKIFSGAFASHINIDHAEDYTYITNLLGGRFYANYPAGAPYPAPIDTWVINNRYGITLRRIDSIKISNVGMFHQYCGFLLADSTVGGLSPANGYGECVNIDIDTCQYGIIGQSADNVGGGYRFSNCNIGGIPTGLISGVTAKAAIVTQTGGTVAPWITWDTGAVRGTWANGFPLERTTGQIWAKNIRGLNPWGYMGALNPAVPASSGNVVNNFGITCRVHIESNTGGPITTVTVNGVAVGQNTTMVILDPGESYGLIYSATPVVKWIGL